MATANLPELVPFTAHEPAEDLSSLTNAFWIWPNLLSLDAVAIALLWQQLFADAAQITLGFPDRIALALPVWMIYVLDRALDGARDNTVPSARHRFYQLHRRVAFLGVLLAACLEMFLAPTLNRSILRGGSLLSLVVFAYFLTVHLPLYSKLRLPKEVAVAGVFSIGTALVSLTATPLTWSLAIPMLLFATLCLLNCSTIEFCESQRYRVYQNSLRPSAVWLARNLKPLSWGVCLSAIALMCLLPAHGIYGALALSSGALICFANTHDRMTADQLRVAADLPLALPVLLLLPRLHGI